jgi:hypothetical protein
LKTWPRNWIPSKVTSPVMELVAESIRRWSHEKHIFFESCHA